MSSDPALAVTGAPAGAAGETTRNRRQEETFRRVLAAGMEMLRESSYADLTVRGVAARAKVAPATAYTYFSSKNHLIAEV
ncbi:helix-turn-helix domain-containing protein, partial [Mycolicibacterium elephantis]